MSEARAIIVGSGPAGLTAAYELLARTRVRPVVLEMGDVPGGLARTVNYRGNRIDLGGHRFFSKSDRVMRWWLHMMPLEKGDADAARIAYQHHARDLAPAGTGPDPRTTDRVMLLRRRKSRIYFRRQFFDYPIRLNADTILKLGPARTIRMGLSYGRALLRPVRNPANLEEFLISRFGREIYRTFFRSYTEKVWGVPCTEIGAEWGAQRIKGLSVAKAVRHALARWLPRRTAGLGQKQTETSLIERFLYPKYGAGQMWDVTADEVRRRGGQIHFHRRAARFHMDAGRIAAVDSVDARTGQTETWRGDFFFSTMPVCDLIQALQPGVPENVRQVSSGLVYRAFVVVGLLLKQGKLAEPGARQSKPLSDNWIYVHDPDIRCGRVQIFNNWSPYMAADPETTWIGMEYFCNESDDLWSRSEQEMIELAQSELAGIAPLQPTAVADATVVRVAKAYPAYTGTFSRFREVRHFLDRLPNLFPIGRNGMHRYNNQDHSMLTAMVAVDNIIRGRTDKSNLWEVNTERDYHEEATSNPPDEP